ncbi:unnamed protein product [Enterobius vermicularis]|uniref:Histone-lysine N-methyltransferase n=1 Tax=Enterobius vermicularis TaxID=51028 RepID=A0A0N4V5U2_ENTVE|nr:unnamed protein product [Enterobius vermicularis]
MRTPGEVQLPPEKIVDVCINGRTVHVNVMQPMQVRFVEDSSLPSSKRSDAVFARYRGTRNAVTLPKRGVRVLQRVAGTTFVCPKDYVKFKMKTSEELDALVEYEVDEEDIEWLRLFNKEMKNEEFLTEETFEKVIDRLEKESFFQCSKGAMGFYNHSVDQDAECCICNDGEVSNVNQIIFCDMCNIPVHQDCYGVPYIPEGIWLCRKCQLSPSSPVECVLCPSSHGAFKQTVDGRWAHVVCATWLNEVHFANNVFLEPIDGVEESLRIRRRLRCIVCKQKRGACLQCSKKSCTRSFHVTCARTAGLEMRTVTINKPNSECDFKYLASCHYHSSAFKREVSSGSDVAKMKRKMDELMKKAREKLQARSHEAPPFSLPTVSSQTLSNIRYEVGISETTMQHVQKYWEQKRSARCGVPLIRRLMVPTKSFQNHKSQRVEGSSENDTVEETNENAFSVIRNWLERTRLLCELVKKREKLKLEYVRYTHCASMVNRYTKPLHSVMSDVLDSITSKDYSNVFANPVTDKEVPGYSTIIKNPMDLSTMRKKLARGEYKKLSNIKDDFVLMMHNCSTFNRHNQWFWKYGHRLNRIGLKYFKAAERNLVHFFVFNGRLLIIKLLKTPETLTAISNIALTRNERSCVCDDQPTTSAKSPKSDTDTPVENDRRFEVSVNGRRGWKRTPMGLSNSLPLKRVKNSGSDFSVEIGYDFQHNDIVWVECEGKRQIGRVVDLRMKVSNIYVLMDNDPVDDMIKERPKDYSQHTLVYFFGKQNSW